MKINKHQIPGYKLIDVIASGGMGTVFKAHQSSLNKVVALKILSPALARDKSYVERFVREARSLAKLNHPNVVTVIDVGKAGEHYYLVMEFVEGKTLADIIDEKGPLPEKEALRVIRSVACALEHAQKNDLIHRDIKPDNVIVSEEGLCKLCDLGLARPAGGSTNLTAAGIAMGTPEYIAPEQARGMSELDIRTDIYSLGATLYDALTGKAPFDGPTPAHIMRAHIDEPLSFPDSPEVSQNVRELIEKMMAKDPARRQQHTRELIEDIDLVLTGRRVRKSRPATTASGAPVQVLEGLRQHLAILGCALGAAAAVIVILTLLMPAPSARPKKKKAAAPREEEQGKPPDLTRKRGRPRTGAEPANPASEPVEQGKPPVAAPEAKLAYEAAAELDKDLSVSVEEVVRAFRAVAENYPDTPWAEMAAARAEELESRRDRLALEAQEEYRDVQARASSLLEEKKYHEALMTITRFASRFEGTPSAGEARRFARQLAFSGARSFTNLCREAESMAKKGDYAGARRILSSLKGTGIPELDEIASEKLDELTKLESASILEKEAANRARVYRELLLELLVYAERGDIEGALSRIADARKEKKYASIADLMEQEESDLRNALTLFGAAEEGLRKRAGSRERFLYRNGSAMWGKILHVEGGTVTIAPKDDAKPSVTISIAELDDRQIVTLAAYGKIPASPVCKLLFYVARGNLEGASGLLEDIKSVFAGRERIEKKLGILKAASDENEAQALAAEVKSAYKSRRFASAALNARKLFENYAYTGFLVENESDIGRYVAQPGLLRIHSKLSSFNKPLSVDVDLLPSFAMDKQLVEQRGVLRARWEGILNVPADGKYTFYIMANGPVRLELGGRKLLRESMGPEVKIVSDSRKLRKGWTEFEFEVTCPKSKQVIVQILWQREGGPRLPLTPADVSYLPARHMEYQGKTK